MGLRIRIYEHLRRTLPVLLARYIAVLLAAGSLAFLVWLLSPSLHAVYVTDSQGNTRAIVTREQDVDALLMLAEVQLEENSICYYTTYPDSDVESISIQNSYLVSVDADHNRYIAAMSGGNVRDVLVDTGVTLGELDYTEPSLNTPVSAGDEITVHRVVYKDTVTYESIPFETEYQYTSLFYKNKKRVVTVQEGSEGTNEITWRERWVDDAFESSQQIAIQMTKAPVNTILKAYAAGAPVSPLTGPDGTTNKPSSYRAVYTGRATGYSSSRARPRGASGRRLSYGTCAVNPALIPYGTLLYIESTDGKFVYGYAIAADTGGALMAGTCLVDLFYESYSESVMNAVQSVNVYVVG